MLPNYRKSKYDTKTLIGRIDKAIENEKEFCENVELFEHTVGSNIGLLYRRNATIEYETEKAFLKLGRPFFLQALGLGGVLYNENITN